MGNAPTSAGGEAEGLDWIQAYAASEIVEYADEGRFSRREMMVRLIAVCGSATAASAFLASCSSGTTSSSSTTAGAAGASSTTAAATGGSTPGTSGSSGTSALGGTSGRTGGTGGTPPPTDGPAGHVLSVAADDPDVKAGDVTFAGPAGELLAYEAQPSASGSRPGIIVIHEIFGLTDHIKDVARRLAKVGFHAVALDLASRAGGTAAAANNVAGALTQGSADDRLADLDATLAHLEAQPDVDGKIGVVGFCYGGGMTYAYAAHQPKVLAAVPYYGPTPQPASQLAATKAAILAHYGETDARVNAGIPAAQEALAGKVFETQIHPGAGHAFNNDTGGAYNETEAVAAWTATIAWFREHLA